MNKQEHDKIKKLEEENELLRIKVAYLEKTRGLSSGKEEITNQDKAVVITVLRQELKCKLKSLLQVAEMSSSSYHDACKRAYKGIHVS